MPSVNQVEIIGHLGAEPEARETKGGSSVANLRIATSEKWTDKSGEKQERTEWHRVSVFGKSAEFCTKYLHKGNLVRVVGSLRTSEYTDKDGNQRKSTEIVAQRVDNFSPKPGGASGSDSPSKHYEEPAEEDDNVPF
jgi:single-strand DNA-binding protein